MRMDPRFRIRTQEGRLLEPRTMEIFGELVRSGVVRDDDEIYDALTGSWQRAARHPMVALFQDPLVSHPSAERLSRRIAEEESAQGAEPAEGAAGALPEATSPAPEAAPSETTAKVESDPEDGEFVLDLVSHAEESPEEAQRAFIERMEEERRRDPDRSARAIELELASPEGSTEAAETTATPPVESRESAGKPSGPGAERVDPAPAREQAVAARASGPATSGTGSQDGPHARKVVRSDAAVELEIPIVVRPPAAPRPAAAWRASGQRRRAAVFAALLLVAVTGVGLSRLARPAAGSGEVAARLEGTAVRATRAVPVTEEQIREEAYAGFLAGVEAMVGEQEVQEVPAAWLEGYYLADPASHPDVPAYWQRYKAYVEAARAGQSDLYREAWLDAASRGGVSGPVRSLRLAAATAEFDARAPEREAHYRHALEMADAALALHRLLLEMEGRITYEPIRGERVSADPVIEAAGTDPDAQARLEAALDRVLLALQRPDGTPIGDRARIPAWLVEGLQTLP